MQKIGTLLLSIILISFTSCEFNQSVSKDLVTGANARGNGIGASSITTTVDGKTHQGTNFSFGQKINIAFGNVTGLKNIDGKTYPKLSISIIKNEKDTISLNNEKLRDLFIDGTSHSPLRLDANFYTILPNQDGEKYKAFIEISDRKGDGKLSYELPFTVKDDNFVNTQKDIKNNGIEYSLISFWNKTLDKPVLNKELSSSNKYEITILNAEGFEIRNEKVFPIYSIDLIDNSGNSVLSSPNIFGSYEEEGMDPLDVKDELTAVITPPNQEIKNPYTLHIKVKDKYSSKYIALTKELNIN